MTNSRRWQRFTKAEDASLRELAGYKPVTAIAEVLGRSLQSIYRRCAAIGVSSRMIEIKHQGATLDNLKALMVVTLYQSGFEVREIHVAFAGELTYESIRDICIGRRRAAQVERTLEGRNDE